MANVTKIKFQYFKPLEKGTTEHTGRTCYQCVAWNVFYYAFLLSFPNVEIKSS